MRFWPFSFNVKQSQSQENCHQIVHKKPTISIKLPAPNKTGGVSLSEALCNRRSIRNISSERISNQQLSDLLWSANGVSYIKSENSDTGINVKYLFTNPTASNHQEISIFVFCEEGVYQYDPQSNGLIIIATQDFRKELSPMPLVKEAAISLCLVADIDKMVHYPDSFRQQLYSTMDTGYVSENIYLHCAANGLATCACGIIEREKIAELLNLTNAKVMLVHPIGKRKATDMEL